MNTIEAANYFVTLVGLICNWKAERGAQATDKFNDFLVYLSEHHFELLRNDIAKSHDLQTQLKGLLTLNLGSMNDHLNVISQGVASLASKIDALKPLTEAVGTSGDGLSDQASQILKVLDQTESTVMVEIPDDSGSFQYIPSNSAVKFSERRFIDADIAALIQFGMIRRDASGGRTKLYSITRLGSRYASQLPRINFDRPGS